MTKEEAIYSDPDAPYLASFADWRNERHYCVFHNYMAAQRWLNFNKDYALPGKCLIETPRKVYV